MKTSGQFQKKASTQSAPIPLSTNLLRSRSFPKPSATVEEASTDTPDFQARLEFARSHAPNLNSLAANSSGDRAPSTIQPKLTVGAPNDQYEQEADRVADQVMSMPDAAAQQPIQREAMPEEEEVRTKPLAASITPLVQREEMLEEELHAKAIDHTLQREEMPEEELRTKPALQRSTDGSLEAGSSIESRLNSSKGGGSPLSDEVRSFMEPRFGADFSQVRVHTGSESLQMNRDLNAQAFAHKQDVYFGAGKAPAKDPLTAHELTHVMQQSSKTHTRFLQRALGGTSKTEVPTNQNNTNQKIPNDLEAFRTQGPYPKDPIGQTIAPQTGLGGFNAHYNPDPSSMKLSVLVNIAIAFADGISIISNRFIAGDPSLKPLANRANKAHGAKRQKIAERVQNDFMWSGQEDGWMDIYKRSVADSWKEKFIFQSTKSGWEGQLAHVDVVINTSKILTSSGPAPAPPPVPGPFHCFARILKTPDNDNSVNARVEQHDLNGSTPQELVLGSGQAITPFQDLTTTIPFSKKSAKLGEKQRNTLRRFIISYQAPVGSGGTNIDITGFADMPNVGDQDPSIRLAERRANKVADFLSTTTVEGRKLANAATRIQPVTGMGLTGSDEVKIIVAGGPDQNVAAHEFGHLIGLGDEYATTPKRNRRGEPKTDGLGKHISRGLVSGTGGQEVGEPTKHDKLSQEMGLGHSVAENNGNIMSLGSTVQPQDYATFMQALREVTNMNEWKLKS